MGNQPSTRNGSGGTQTDGEFRAAMVWIVGQLRQLAARIGALCATVPEPGDRFEVQAELASALDCVNRDLIQDAIQTLDLAATSSEAELRRQFDWRRLAAPRRID